MKLRTLLVGALFLVAGGGIHSVTAPFYHTYAVARIEATAEKICVVGVPGIDTTAFMERRSQEEYVRTVPVQMLSFKVEAVEEFIGRDPAIESIVVGETLEVTNPFAAEVLSFQVGDRVRMRIRLVLPEQQFDPEDARARWWFFPDGDKEEHFAPRRPFAGVQILGDPQSE